MFIFGHQIKLSKYVLIERMLINRTKFHYFVLLQKRESFSAKILFLNKFINYGLYKRT